MRLGLVVNPVAGIGGRVGLKGSDGAEVQQRALALGARPESHLRAGLALQALVPLRDRFDIVTAPGTMGADLARSCGFAPQVIGELPPGPTRPLDTQRFTRVMSCLPVDLLLFAGGDGTARDIYDAVGAEFPVLGIPAGVKIHSAVFATHPRTAGELAAAVIRGERTGFNAGEVVDLDEEAYRNGVITTRLYGYLKVPILPQLLQNRKAPTPDTEAARLEAIAAAVIDTMQPGWAYILGPGTTTRAIAGRLGFPKTLAGVDAYSREAVLALDASEARLLELLDQQPARIVVTPIGGQGFLFGRGNQPISPAVLRKVGRENILVVSLVEKLNALQGGPLLVDSGDPALDQMLAGYLPVVVGYREKVVYRVSS